MELTEFTSVCIHVHNLPSRSKHDPPLSYVVIRLQVTSTMSPALLCVCVSCGQIFGNWLFAIMMLMVCAFISQMLLLKVTKPIETERRS